MLTYYMPLSTSHFSEREQDLLRYVSDERRAAIDRVRFDDSKMLTLYSALLARYAICKLNGLCNNDLVFSRSEHGKPFLTGHDNIDFNISHTKGMIICGVTDSGRVGVDVEHVRPLKYNIMKRCFHPAEIDFVESNNDDRHFFEIWTKKEAYTKYLGTGLAFDITKVNMLSKDHDDKLYCFEDNGFVFSVYCDFKDDVSPLMISADHIMNAFES